MEAEVAQAPNLALDRGGFNTPASSPEPVPHPGPGRRRGPQRHPGGSELRNPGRFFGRGGSGFHDAGGGAPSALSALAMGTAIK